MSQDPKGKKPKDAYTHAITRVTASSLSAAAEGMRQMESFVTHERDRLKRLQEEKETLKERLDQTVLSLKGQAKEIQLQEWKKQHELQTYYKAKMLEFEGIVENLKTNLAEARKEKQELAVQYQQKNKILNENEKLLANLKLVNSRNQYQLSDLYAQNREQQGKIKYLKDECKRENTRGNQLEKDRWMIKRELGFARQELAAAKKEIIQTHLKKDQARKQNDATRSRLSSAIDEKKRADEQIGILKKEYSQFETTLRAENQKLLATLNDYEKQLQKADAHAKDANREINKMKALHLEAKKETSVFIKAMEVSKREAHAANAEAQHHRAEFTKQLAEYEDKANKLYSEVVDLKNRLKSKDIENQQQQVLIDQLEHNLEQSQALKSFDKDQ